MKAILNNIDFENNKIMAKWIIPILIVLDVITVIVGLVEREWAGTALFLFSTVYIVCNLVMYVQVQVPKKYAIFLFVYAFPIAVYAAYSLWTHNWGDGIIYGVLVVLNTIALKFRINEKKEEAEEEKEHVDF